jgi:UDP-galactopyranose mutase
MRNGEAPEPAWIESVVHAEHMMKKADLVCFSHLRWGFVFQRPNHLMTRCARERRTFFWEEPVFDLDASAAPFLERRTIAENLVVLTPHFAAISEGDDDVIDGQRLLLDRTLAKYRIDEPILWFYTPMLTPVAAHVTASAVVYDAMDELSNFQGAPADLRMRETELLAFTDLVFTGGRSLYEVKKHLHPRVTAFPSSVDRVHFARARDPQVVIPADQASLPEGPRIGFFGVIDERIDRALLAAIADARPGWQVVMVGPVVKMRPESLPVRPNLHYLGQRSYDDLPRYLAGWDVAIMPFALNDATRFISPTKTLEYLAAGVPVVSTPIADVVHPYLDLGIVRVAADPDAFVQEVEAALTDHREPRRSIADAYVAKTSWDATWRAMSELIASTYPRKSRPVVVLPAIATQAGGIS